MHASITFHDGWREPSQLIRFHKNVVQAFVIKSRAYDGIKVYSTSRIVLFMC